MEKNLVVGIINTLGAAGANVKDDTTASQWTVVADNTASPLVPVLPPIQYGKCLGVEYIAAALEVRQISTIGASVTKETIVASTRYRVEIGADSGEYETWRNPTSKYAYTSPAVLSGNAATDRANVYTALVNKINAYAGNNVTAHLMHYQAFTLGTDSASTIEGFTIGEVITQQTSGVTARVARWVLTAGTFVGDNAAGGLWFFYCSATGSLDAGTKTWTGATTTCVCTGTAASIVLNVGITIEDDAGYFTSSLDRGGITYLGVTQGFLVDTAVTTLAGVYPIGVGTEMITQHPVFTQDHQDLVSGNLEYNLTTLPTAGKYYTKCIIKVQGGDEDAIDGQSVNIPFVYIVWADESDGTNLTNFKAALAAAAVK